MKVAIPKSTFTNDWKLFFKRLHNRRSHIVKTGESQKFKPRMTAILDKLQPYVDYNFNEEGTARFILKHKGEIRELLVEGNVYTITRFSLFVTQATALLNPSLTWS